MCTCACVCLRAARSAALKRDLTLLHGDFHSGNILTRIKTPPREEGQVQEEDEEEEDDVCIVDWQNFGAGHPAWDIMYYSIPFPPG